MSVVALKLNDPLPSDVRGGVVAVGNFDGVHRGHAALIQVARACAGPTRSVVPVTFDPHPLVLLAPERYQPPLTTVAEKCRLLHALGANHVVVMQTTPDLLALTPERFFETVVLQTLGARGMVEGFNFRFGHDRAGSNETLRILCERAGVEFREVPAYQEGGQPVSSSRVREAIATGDIAVAKNLLGRPYRLTGRVGTGAKRGRTIGFPTANLENVETILPAVGVYAVCVTTAAGVFAGAANIGPNPTFGDDACKIEVHLADFSGDLYGEQLLVDFVAGLRGTIRFPNVDALVAQMRQDVAAARALVEHE
jgi:riboflavin kinase/FMN adenylyltransferase